MGPVTALRYIIENKNMEGVLRKIKNENLNPKKKKPFIVPEEFNFESARELFSEPDVVTDKAKLEADIKFGKCDEKKIREFLIYSKGFGE